MGRRKTSRVTAKARFLLLVTLTFFGLCTIARSEESLRILYYFIGGDLESLGGAASADIEEILQAEPSSGVRVFIMAGGAYRWRIPEAAECGTTIFEVQNHELVPFVRNQEGRIGTGEALDDFIHRCTADGIPWDLVFWGHGMPGMGGIGTDQTSQDGDSLTLTEIRGVLMNNVHRPRIIGLDACAMGKLETAWTLSDCAELLIADTLDEPIRGWQHNLYISNADGQMSNDLNAMRAAAVSYRERSTGEISAVILNMAGIRDRYCANSRERHSGFGTFASMR